MIELEKRCLDKSRGILPNIETSFTNYFMCGEKNREIWEKEFHYWLEQWKLYASNEISKSYKKRFDELKDYDNKQEGPAGN